jgi:molecular chaperone DnaK
VLGAPAPQPIELDEDALPLPEMPDEEVTRVGAPRDGRDEEEVTRVGTARELAPEGPAPRPYQPAAAAGSRNPFAGTTMLGGLGAPPARAPAPTAAPYAPPPPPPPIPAPLAATQVMQAAPAIPAAFTPQAPTPQPIAPMRAPQPSFGSLETPGLPGAPQFGGFEPVPAPRTAPPPPLLIDVTPLTLAVETVNGFCDSIIERNTQVPCERTRVFVTAVDNQTLVRVRIAQGESSRFGENTLLGEVELAGLTPARRSEVQIAVSFSLDTNGMLNVSAQEVATGRATSATVRLVALPDASDIAWMTQRNAARQI